MLELLRHQPLLSVAEAQRRAEKILPPAVYISFLAGQEKGLTLDDNIDAFDELGFLPVVGAELPPERDMRTSVLGQEIDLPVVISPVAVQAVAPGGEVPVARAAAAMGTAIGHSNFASMPFPDVVAANPKAFFQLYWTGSRDDIATRIEWAREAGAKALIMTLDASFYLSRDWPSPLVPERIDLAAAVRYGPSALAHPRWLLRYLRRAQLPELTVPNLAIGGRPPPTLVEAYTEWARTPTPTWSDVRWVRELWGGPFMVKGIMVPDDARRAVDVGATAISVSNHGGNNLDGTPSGLRILPTIADAVGDDVEITFDGGVRRGTDVVKALALGARAVLIGRAWIYGLAADGERGVREVLEVLRAGIDKGLTSLGRASIHDLRREDLVIPEDFEVPRSSTQVPVGAF